MKKPAAKAVRTRPALSHLDAGGKARMVDVGAKASSDRRALAEARVSMRPATLRRVRANRVAKGSVVEVARLAGIQAAKRTADLIPLCHPLALTSIRVDVAPAGNAALRIESEVRATDRTGVEMEALTAACVAALTVYDMLKGVDKDIEIGPVRLLEKDGGKSGPYRRARRADRAGVRR